MTLTRWLVSGMLLIVAIVSGSGMGTARAAGGAGMMHTVDGIQVALVQAARPKHLPDRGLPALRRGYSWLETTWTFRNVTDHAARLQRPVVATNRSTARAFSPDAAGQLDVLQPHRSRRVDWYFQVPRPASGVWIRYGTEGTVIWYHVKLRV